MPSTGSPAPLTRSGVVAIIGQPNAGKSSLLNALVGETIAIVSDKPQTTRVPVVGIRTDRDSQIRFTDHPGILEPRYLMHQAMREANIEHVMAADAVLYLTPVQQDWVPLAELEPELASLGRPMAHVRSKVDLRGAAQRTPPEPRFDVSTQTGQGLDGVIEWCKLRLPEGPFEFQPDDISTQPTRFFVAEYVREAAFHLLEEEIPYAVATEVDEFREGTEPLYIRVTLYVERESQKGIVVGRGGSTVREIGKMARQRIEALLGQQVFLDLWVKVLPKWRTRATALARFGLPLSTGKST